MKAFFIVLIAVFMVYVNSQNLKPQCPDDLNENHTMIVHPCNCSSFFVCTTDPPIPMECPAGLQFDETRQICDYKWRVKCKPKEGCNSGKQSNSLNAL
ncbi:peritrophin-1-like [Apis florea]|uniref:peritrophin-1-like n=1 Tax=Apis florea TaxID=7463 RepID=UPI0006292683|nr:peritrophin-1-like [Apis florea]